MAIASSVPQVLVTVAVLALLTAKPPLLRAEGGATPHHLVGHEELELLARVQDVIDDWDPRKLTNPLVVTSHAVDGQGQLAVRKQFRRPDLAEFISDISAAEALGKAFFWEMQAGSDFRRTSGGVLIGTACASCHYRHGADARNRHTRRIPYVAWDQYRLHQDHPLEFRERQQPFPVFDWATQTIPFEQFQPAGPFSLIVGSQGVESRLFKGFPTAAGELPPAGWESELSTPRPVNGFQYRPEWSMFIDGDDRVSKRFRQITNRNSPTVINSGFSDRLFHDGRAESTFNGFSIFGDADKREVIHRRQVTQILDLNGKVVGQKVDTVPVQIAITNAALASQAVGPVVNDIEMSYLGRQFPNLARKLLPARVLGYQNVDSADSVLAGWGVGQQGKLTYEQLIRRAFRHEWWDDTGLVNQTDLVLLRDCEADGAPVGSLMEANFSLYWGLAIMLYEASLVSNESPFDDMMRGRSEKVEAKWAAVKSETGPDDRLQPIYRDQRIEPPRVHAPEHESGAAVFQHGFRVFINRGCIECHAGPLFSELSERHPEDAKFPIHQEIERSLLPNSRADAIAISLKDARVKLHADLVEKLTARFPAERQRAGKIARELDLLRQASRGEKSVLIAQVGLYLKDAFPSAGDPLRQAVAAELGQVLFLFEKSLVAQMGDRTFFTETERVAMAEAIGERVLVEKMLVPEDQVGTRPKLPIHGPLANEHYAFYDFAFYAIGVAPPRYDRGIGDKKGSSTELSTAVLEAVAQLSASARVEDQRVAKVAREALAKTGRAADARAAVQQEALPPDAKLRFEQAVIEQAAIQQAAESAQSTSSPGNAYRFKRSWATERRKTDADRQNEKRAVRQVAAGARSSGEGPRCDLDAEMRGPAIDTSWDRIDVPFGDEQVSQPSGKSMLVPGPGRRSEYYFLSRARRMVSNEEFWGYRKPFLHDNELAFWGAFKTPTLRNVELTAPYMHNGRLMTLMDVVEFYADEERQIPRSLTANPDKHPAMKGFDLTESDKRALVFFLLCLTDDRVRREEGPFDHPSLELVNGYQDDGAGRLEDVLISIPAVGSKGHPEFSGRFPSEH